ncbi:class I adenylate-forming enzyme family protein [endosymbiont of Riftia pachyptila]|uniref:2-succinylbenzoate--CoA ligase n=1 Tax=endosymbiont of Riftia pachyptila (vent Ph05) TaxID=1048808 RepID=G2DEG7_9GAMM|nr:class I adenylate-forming enzyme family protein [endosymbiont of Riftia pachyptila]EGV50985.1 2-succinylbenzoate--CoA ligase [endosymbiont of Riftia pachyptila (vent Ph05)]
MAAELSQWPGDWLLHAAGRYPSRPAIWLADRQVSYAELEQQVARFSRRLPLEPADRVVGLLSADPQLLLLLLYAGARLGVALLPLDPQLAPERRQRLLQQSGCRLLITDQPSADHPAGVRLIPAAYLLGDSGAGPVPICKVVPSDSPDRVLLIIATSGSTGDPKGVMLSASSLAASTAAVNAALGLGSADRWLNCLPFYHIAGLAILYRCLRAGAGVVLQQGFDVVRVWDALHRYRATHISLVPAMLSRLLDHAETCSPPDSLRVALIGGGPLSPRLAQRARQLGWPLVISYGMSETGSMCLMDDSQQAGLEAGVVGAPLAGFELQLNGVGRIRLRGPALMVGYANPQLQPGAGLENGWFESGDLGQLSEQGQLRLLGRADDMLISGGRNIHPQEVERCLQACPGLTAAAVTSSHDLVWGERLVAFYVGDISCDALEQWAREQLPSALRPRRFVQLESLPCNCMGKLDRQALKVLAN